MSDGSLFYELWFWMSLLSIAWIAVLTIFVHYVKTNPNTERRISSIVQASADSPSSAGDLNSTRRTFRFANFLFYVMPKTMYLMATTSNAVEDAAVSSPQTNSIHI